MPTTALKPKPLANHLVPKVQVRLDGKDWPLVVTHNVLCELEDMTGLNVLFGAEATIAKPSAKLVRALLYLCLREQGAPYSVDEVGALITQRNLHLVIRGLVEAYIAAMPSVEEMETDQADPTTAVG